MFSGILKFFTKIFYKSGYKNLQYNTILLGDKKPPTLSPSLSPLLSDVPEKRIAEQGSHIR